ncbi:MAG: malectin domain-containing carbohydrate-binding protein, partial [Spirochaetota bacterium]
HLLARRRVDLASEYGRGTAAEIRFHVPVEDGVLDLSFEPEAGDGVVSAIVVRKADPMAGVHYAINVGGPAYVGTNGIRYSPDDHDTGGWTRNRVRDVDETLDDVLYHSWREGTFAYELPIENGTYLVELHFSDFMIPWPGLRQFDVRIEHHEAFADLDIVAESGSRSTALVKTYEVVVSDGALSLRFLRDRLPAMVSAVVVRDGDPMFNVHHAVNLGGDGYRATTGIMYAGDPAGAGLQRSGPVHATYDDVLFQSLRAGDEAYAVRLDPGPYEISVGSAATTDGDQTVTATAEGAILLNAVPLARDTATVGALDVRVHDGELNVALTGTPEAAAAFLLVRTGDPMTGIVHAINAGGDEYLAANGIRYEPDKFYEGGEEERRWYPETDGTEDDSLYATWREGEATYTLPVTPGSYEVTLRFAEPYYPVPGLRVFTATVGSLDLGEIDLAAAVGRATAYDLTVPVRVEGTELVIEIKREERDPILGAIVVREAE